MHQQWMKRADQTVDAATALGVFPSVVVPVHTRLLRGERWLGKTLKLVAKEDTMKPTVYRRRSFQHWEEVRERFGEGLFRNRREGPGNVWRRTSLYLENIRLCEVRPS